MMTKFNNIVNANAELMEKLRLAFVETCALTSNKIVIGNPVDTTNSRGNWQASINTRITGEIKGVGRTENPKSVYSAAGLNDTLYFSNNTKYIEPLELGWSSQQPNGWIRATVAKGQEDLQNIIYGIEGR